MPRPHHTLSRRERQIMDILYERGRATASDVQDGLHDSPSYSAVRAALAGLEAKGHIRHEKDGARFVFIPTLSAGKAKQSALRHLIRTFFGGSGEKAVTALLDASRLTGDELDRLANLIEEQRKGKKD